MKFEWRQAHGKAGERAVEAFVEEQLGFIYRKVGPPDIGVDGEIEIIGAKRESTGALLMVQVKATERSFEGHSTVRLPLGVRHLDYFSKLSIQPIIAVVSLADDVILWKPILHKSNYVGPKGRYGITFDVVADRMSKLSAVALSMLAERSNGTIAGYLLEEAEDHLATMDDHLANRDYDYITVESWAQRLASVRNVLRDAQCLLKYERRYSAQITKVHQQYEEISTQLYKWRDWFEDNGQEGLLSRYEDDD